MGLGTMEEGSLIFLLFELGGGKWEDLVNIIEQIAWHACAIYIFQLAAYVRRICIMCIGMDLACGLCSSLIVLGPI